MKKLKTGLVASVAMLAASATPLLAQANGGLFGWLFPTRPRPVAVPEIDASSGIIAVAAVLAALAFVWERNRRRA